MTQTPAPADKPATKQADQRPKDTTKTKVSEEQVQNEVADLQEKADKHAEQGFEGTRPPGPTGEAYSLQSGPDSPGAYDIQKGEWDDV